MRKATIDLTGCKYLGEFFQRVTKALNFPEGHVENWYGFEDALTIDCPMNFITVKGMNTVDKKLLPYLAPMREIMEQHKQYWKNSRHPFDYEFVDA